MAADVLLLDGATGTELDRRGVDVTLPLWSARALIDAPQELHRVHVDYLDADGDQRHRRVVSPPRELPRRDRHAHHPPRGGGRLSSGKWCELARRCELMIDVNKHPIQRRQ